MPSAISKSNYKNIGWSFMDRFGSQGIAFVFNIFLTRILSPEDFGLIGMIVVFIALGQTLVDSGMTSSLIRKTNPDNTDFSVVFAANLLFSLAVYVIIFFLAPIVADFYDQPSLVNILRIYSLGFIFIALSAIQQTVLIKDLAFRRLTKIRIPAALISGIIGVLLAWKGFGVWSLVWMYLCNQVLLSCLFWSLGIWKPQVKFDFSRFKEHFSFGYKLSIAGILNTVFDNIYNVLIGRFFPVSTLGFYTRANMMKQYPVETFSSALQKVTYPLFSIQKENISELKNSFEELTQRVIFLIAPLMLIGSALAEPIFLVLFGEKWLPAVPYFQILCFTGVLYPIHSYNLNILNVFGRSDLFLKLEIIKKIQIVLVILFAFQFGIYGLIWAQVFASFTAFFINTFYTGKFIDYGFLDQLYAIFPMISLASLSGLFLFFLQKAFWFTEIKPIFLCVILIPIGIIFYLILNLLFRTNPSMDLLKWSKIKFVK